MINEGQAVVARYLYDPFGNLLAKSGPMAEANQHRFASKEWHGQSGLIYFGQRYYDAALQRWINADPIEEDAGVNLHQYVANSPIAALDAWGLASRKVPKQVQTGGLAGDWFVDQVSPQAFFGPSAGRPVEVYPVETSPPDWATEGGVLIDNGDLSANPPVMPKMRISGRNEPPARLEGWLITGQLVGWAWGGFESDQAYTRPVISQATGDGISYGDALRSHRRQQLTMLSQDALFMAYPWWNDGLPASQVQATFTATVITIPLGFAKFPQPVAVGSGANILENAARGNAFESQVLEALGATKNTTRVSAPGLGSSIPDVMGGGITEIKDAVSISFTRQLQVQAAAARGPLNLIVGPRTQHISGPLQRVVEQSGGSIRVFDPATRAFRSWR